MSWLRKLLSVFNGMLFGLVLLAFPATGKPFDTRLKIESVRTLPVDRGVLEGGVAIESDRTLDKRGPNPDLDYDNLRLAPLGFRYGLAVNNPRIPKLEVGLRTGFSFNSGDDRLDPDETGLESLTGFVKHQWSPNVATRLQVSAFGNDELLPYGNDGLDFGVNVPFSFPLRTGSLYGEVGYTSKTGEFRGSRDFEDYTNFGIGYSHKAGRLPPVNLELVGHESTVERGEDHLEFVMGTPLRSGRRTMITPWVGTGLDDGSPDLSVGLKIQRSF